MKYPFCSMAPPTLLMFFLVEQCRPVRKPDKIVIHNHLFIAKALQCHQTWNKAVVSLFPFVSYVVKDNWKTYSQIMVHKKSNRGGLRIEKKNSAIWIKVWNDWNFAKFIINELQVFIDNLKSGLVIGPLQSTVTKFLMVLGVYR